MKKNILTLLFAIMAVLIFASCSNNIAVTPTSMVSQSPATTSEPTATPTPIATQAMPTPAMTPAEKFVMSVTKEQLHDIISKATGLVAPLRPFSSVENVKTSSLLNFFTVVETGYGMEQWYNKDDYAYYVPLKKITAVLDQYLDGYKFDPKSFGSDFNEATGIIKIRAYGYDWNYEYKVDSIMAISDDLVQINVGFIESYLPNKTDPTLKVQLIIKITSTGYHFISFVLI